MRRIHPNLQSAREACAAYAERLEALLEELGISSELGDSCDTEHISAQYYDEAGNVNTYYWC